MSKHFISYLLALLPLFFLTDCKKWFKDEEFTLIRQSFSGTELRVDGYYYYDKDGVIFCSYFFYRNGVMVDGGASVSGSSNPIAFLDSTFRKSYFAENIKKDKTCWGVFDIHNDSIVFERWINKQGGFPVLRFSGNIINDTTFRITRSEYPHHGEMYERNDVFHFHAFSPKPDSTNVFIP